MQSHGARKLPSTHIYIYLYIYNIYLYIYIYIYRYIIHIYVFFLKSPGNSLSVLVAAFSSIFLEANWRLECWCGSIRMTWLSPVLFWNFDLQILLEFPKSSRMVFAMQTPQPPLKHKFCVERILLRHHLFILQICLIVIYCLLNTFNELQQLRCSKICLGWGLVPLFTFHTSKLRQNNMSRPKEKSNESSRNMASGCFKQSYDQNIWR